MRSRGIGSSGMDVRRTAMRSWRVPTPVRIGAGPGFEPRNPLEQRIVLQDLAGASGSRADQTTVSATASSERPRPERSGSG